MHHHRIETMKDKRTKLLVRNVIASFFIKGWAACVTLMMVPLTLKCLGVYQNGVWLTISSLLVWVDHMDIGLGNGLRNKLALHMAHQETEEARKVIRLCHGNAYLHRIPSPTDGTSSGLV